MIIMDPPHERRQTAAVLLMSARGRVTPDRETNVALLDQRLAEDMFRWFVIHATLSSPQ